MKYLYVLLTLIYLHSCNVIDKDTKTITSEKQLVETNPKQDSAFHVKVVRYGGWSGFGYYTIKYTEDSWKSEKELWEAIIIKHSKVDYTTNQAPYLAYRDEAIEFARHIRSIKDIEKFYEHQRKLLADATEELLKNRQDPRERNEIIIK